MNIMEPDGRNDVRFRSKNMLEGWHSQTSMLEDHSCSVRMSNNTLDHLDGPWSIVVTKGDFLRVDGFLHGSLGGQQSITYFQSGKIHTRHSKSCCLRDRSSTHILCHLIHPAFMPFNEPQARSTGRLRKGQLTKLFCSIMPNEQLPLRSSTCGNSAHDLYIKCCS